MRTESRIFSGEIHVVGFANKIMRQIKVHEPCHRLFVVGPIVPKCVYRLVIGCGDSELCM